MKGTWIMKAQSIKMLRTLKSTSKYIVIGCLVGLFVGGINSAFLKSLEVATENRLQHPWLIFFLPLAGVFVSFLYVKLGKQSSKGNNLILEKINHENVKIPLRMAPLVFLGTVLTHLFGGSAGREGTGVQMGGSIADWISRVLKLSKQDSRIILMSGVSSGFAAVFGTPLAGTVFGLEVAALGFMSYESIIPCATAAYIGNAITGLLGVSHSHYVIQSFISPSLANIIKIILAAVAFGLISRIFSKLTHKLKELFSSSFENAMLKSFIGGVIIILLVFLVGSRDYIGLSLPLIKESMEGQVSPFAFIWKTIFTSITLGTGFQGGEVTPLFVIGSTLGNFLGTLMSISPSHLAALGLIGVFAGATNTPFASFILGIELFGANGIEFLFLNCIVSYFSSGHTGIYSSQKIAKSKHSIVTLPDNSTLGSIAKKKKDRIINTNIKLSGQFCLGRSSIELPVKPGLNLFVIKSKMKGLVLSHNSFNPDSATWTSPPNIGEQNVSVLPDDDKIYAIQVHKVHDRLDKVLLTNSNLISNVEVNYTNIDQSGYDRDLSKQNKEINNQFQSKKLFGQFKWGFSSFELESEMGINKYVICVSGGTVRLNHDSYNPDGHFYSQPAQNGEPAHRDLSPGIHNITVNIGTSCGKKDIITIVNISFFKEVEVKYQMVSDEENDLTEIVD
nr:voltage-gated chloride channel family protein [Pseudobacteroides cellulosolvens]